MFSPSAGQSFAEGRDTNLPWPVDERNDRSDNTHGQGSVRLVIFTFCVFGVSGMDIVRRRLSYLLPLTPLLEDTEEDDGVRQPYNEEERPADSST